MKTYIRRATGAAATALSSFLLALPSTQAASAPVDTGVWLWSGTGDWFDPNNWQYGWGPTLNAPYGVGNTQPSTSLPIYFGAAWHLVNGVWDGTYLPVGGPAVLAQDFTAPQVTLTTGGNSTLTITNGATLNAPTYVGYGQAYPVADGPGTATLNLQNGSINGSLYVGFVRNGIVNVADNAQLTGNLFLASAGGEGTLNVATGANLNVSGAIQASSGTGTINNAGNITFAQSLSLSRSSTLSNLAGGTLVMDGSTSSIGFWLPGNSGRVVNAAGATIERRGSDISYINVDLENEGLIYVREGLLRMSNIQYRGNGAMRTDAGAKIDFVGELSEDISLEMNGAFSRFSPFGTGNVRLSGDSTIDLATIVNTVENVGAVSVSALQSSGMDARWINQSGSTFTLRGIISPNNNAFQGAFVNTEGATMIVEATTTADVFWSLINNGRIDVRSGNLSIRGSYGGDGTIKVANGSYVDFAATLPQDTTIDMTGAFRQFNVGGPGTLHLKGNYTIDNTSNGATVVSEFGTTVINYGEARFTRFLRPRDANAVWANQAGATLTLDGNGTGLSSNGVLVGILENRSGSTLIRRGEGLSTITWNVKNDGLIDVREGQLNIGSNVQYRGSGAIRTAEGASISLTVDLPEAATIEMSGMIQALDVGGPGTLHLSGDYTLAGVTRLATLLENHGAARMTGTFLNTTGAGRWTNHAGSTLIFAPVTSVNFSATELINEKGASIVSQAPGTLTITSKVQNDGLIDIQSGAAAMTGIQYRGHGAIRTAPGATLDFAVDLREDAALEMNGTFRRFDPIGSGQLDLSGTYTIANSSGTTSVRAAVVNHGAGTLTGLYRSSGGTGHWTNATGSSLVMEGNNASFSLSGTARSTLVNSQGATLIRRGEGSSSIGWSLENNGRLEVESGTLVLYSTPTGTGEYNIHAGAQLQTFETLILQTGATLSGSGTFWGSVSLAAGSLIAPGNSPGTLTINGNLELLDGGRFAFELGPTAASSDHLNLLGGVSFTGPGAISIDLLNVGLVPGTYTLASFGFRSGFTEDNITLGRHDYDYAYDFDLSNTTLSVNITSIPEPAAYAALCGGAVLLGALWRRRRAQVG